MSRSGLTCGTDFAVAAAAELRSLQEPINCRRARLLVAGETAESFEGVASTLMAVVEAQAEAYYSKRTLLWGPSLAHPNILLNASCGKSLGFECYFQPLGACVWEDHVYREEAERFATAPFEEGARVRMQHPRRGGPALYVPPPRLERMLPSATRADPAAAAECWAGALASRVVRISEGMQPRLDKRLERAFAGMRRPVVGMHFRAGDVMSLHDSDGGRVYSNRAEPTPGRLAQTLLEVQRKYSQRMSRSCTAAATAGDGASELACGGDEGSCAEPVCEAGGVDHGVGSIFLATDAHDAAKVALAVRGEVVRRFGCRSGKLFTACKGKSTGGKMKVREAGEVGAAGEAGEVPEAGLVVRADSIMLRLEKGTHTSAFADGGLTGHHELTMPYELALEASGTSGNDKERVRTEAIEDIWTLAHTDLLVGTASSTFSVLARLLMVGLGRAANPHGWMDTAVVSSGEMSHSFMHGTVNATHRLLDGSERMQRALSRLLPLDLTGAEAVMRLDPRDCTPLVPRQTFAEVAASWSRPDGAGSNDGCMCDPAGHPSGANVNPTSETGCDMVALINEGASAHDGKRMNKELARLCWRRSLFVPGRTRFGLAEDVPASDPSGYDNPTIRYEQVAEFGEIARENLLVMEKDQVVQYGRYTSSSETHLI